MSLCVAVQVSEELVVKVLFSWCCTGVVRVLMYRCVPVCCCTGARGVQVCPSVGVQVLEELVVKVLFSSCVPV